MSGLEISKDFSSPSQLLAYSEKFKKFEEKIYDAQKNESMPFLTLENESQADIIIQLEGDLIRQTVSCFSVIKTTPEISRQSLKKLLDSGIITIVDG